ncbi:unnamed protein product (macronuclear) [Paramecium tetraurelia]|uniref:Uncharacterized protein n=1 Tax=Paramecium tetraurelia TaxID=5888 RepID=A0EHU1_PARTE|nr:uncharacterized protein GSPATT00027209001 [Paramecium tetraurelia]CAK94882.1 unnamed protein product [Paramecium tetraurelia]|eukprot:XP_001462255.1 hypothetical protein (macronuclear) [Paramecium tetraurelia strain d4-2]
MNSNSKSIYKNVEFQDEPYSTNNKFAVYVPKQEIPRYSATQQVFYNQQAQQSPQKHLKVEFQDEQENRNQQNQNEQQQFEQEQQQQSQCNQPKADTHKQRNVTQNRYRLSNQTPKTAQGKEQQKFYSSTPSQSIQKQRTLQQFKDSLYFDERINKVPKSTIRNQIIDSIVSDADLLLQKRELMTSIYKLKQLNLLKNKEFAVNRLPGIGKSSFVCNDYHTKSTNNGYSRNFGGVFYTR